MKRILATALAVLLIATMAISGSVAYLTSTDNDTNTFTMGDVEIIQHEKDREGNDFNNEQNLLPGHEFRDGHNAATTSVGINDIVYNLWNTESGAIDKIVTVENTGKTKAYVRTIFALEDTGMIATNNQIKLNWNEFAGEVNKDITGRVLINGEYYRLYEYIYTTELAPEATTAPSLLQVAMSAKVGNDVVDAIAASADGHYTILVATQAVQYDNMIGDNGQQMTAKAALDAAFYDVTSEKNPWTMNEVEGSEAENAGTVIYLNSKSDVLAKLGGNITTNTTFILTDDIDMGGASLPTTNVGDNSYGCNVKFVGNGHTISDVVLTKNDVKNNGMYNIGLFALPGGDTNHRSQLTVENLTLKKVSISGEVANETIGAAAVVGYANNFTTVTLKNVNVFDANINNTVGNASVFVGYTTSNVTMTDCGAYNCTIKGDAANKTGTFVGTIAGAGNVTVSDSVNGAKSGYTESKADDYGRKLDDSVYTGTGMEGVLVSSASELHNALTALNTLPDGSYMIALSNDITLTGNWTPVDINLGMRGYTYPQMNVVIDGKGHSIKNLKTDGSADKSGLIGNLLTYETNITIQNINIEDIAITGKANGHAAALIANAEINGDDNVKLVVKNVHVNGGTISGSKYAGGLIGQVNGVNNSAKFDLSGCSVTGVNATSSGHAGSLVGYVLFGNLKNNVVKNTTVKVTSGTYVGALVGTLQEYGVIGTGNSCENVKIDTANVTSQDQVVGSIKAGTVAEVTIS